MKIRELKISEIQPAAYNPQEESPLKTKSKGKRRKSNTVPGASDIEVLGGSVGGSMKRSYSQNPSEKRFAINDQVVLDDKVGTVVLPPQLDGARIWSVSTGWQI